MRAVVEDAEGVVWFGGQLGLSRYDGKRFQHYTTSDGLPSNQVWSLLIDRSKQLWIGTEGGIARYDGKRFIPFELPVDSLPDAQPRFSTKLACVTRSADEEGIDDGGGWGHGFAP